MLIKKYFPSLIGFNVYDKHSKIEEKLFNKCLKLMNTIKKGGNNWISKDTYNTLGTYNFFKDNSFKELNKFILKSIKDYCDQLKIDKSKLNFNIDDAWFNYYNKGDYQEFHIHKSVLSIVYFLKGPLDGGKINFKTPLNPLNDIPYLSYDEHTFRSLFFDIVPGTLIIFDSSLEHSVSKHNSFDPRITLAANIYKK
jgi:uncharacterized protein (TIGR02466 family)